MTDKNAFKKFLSHPYLFFYRLACSFPNLIKDDKTYLKLRYPICLGKKLDLKNPKTYNEKLQWLKLYDRNPLYTKMVDKITAKDYVAEIIGDDIIIKTIAVYNNVDEIDWEKLPNQFVIKCTHDSGGIVICKDKSKLNIANAEKKLRECLLKDNYSVTREWPYKNVPRRLICEEYMVDESKDFTYSHNIIITDTTSFNKKIPYALSAFGIIDNKNTEPGNPILCFWCR